MNFTPTQIAYEVDGPVATITLDRPDRLNAFTVEMMSELIQAFDLSDADDRVRAVILTGRGRGFCAGADLGPGGSTFDHGDAEGGRRAPATAAGWSACACSGARSRSSPPSTARRWGWGHR